MRKMRFVVAASAAASMLFASVLVPSAASASSLTAQYNAWASWADGFTPVAPTAEDYARLDSYVDETQSLLNTVITNGTEATEVAEETAVPSEDSDSSGSGESTGSGDASGSGEASGSGDTSGSGDASGSGDSSESGESSTSTTDGSSSSSETTDTEETTEEAAEDGDGDGDSEEGDDDADSTVNLLKATSPLDFSKYAQDPLDFNMPAAASKFKTADSTWTIPRPTAGGTSVGTVPEGLSEFYSQTVSWGDCTPFGYDPGAKTAQIECGYAIVPMDYSNPNGPTIAIGMLKVKAADQANKLGTLFTDPGGPGGSGMGYAYGSADSYSETLRKFDVIGFDPRGVGGSLPQIRCQSSAAFTAQREGSDELSGEDLDKILEYNTNQCYANTAKGFIGLSGDLFIPHVGTSNVVRDLDVMRSIVGDEKLTYIGYSYGTAIGYSYAKLFTDNIRALVLDGQVNPLENNLELLNSAEYKQYLPAATSDAPDVSQMRGFGETFRQFLISCLKNEKVVTSVGGRNGWEDTKCALADSNETITGEPTEAQINAAYARYQAIAQKAWGTGYYFAREASRPNGIRPVSFADVTMGAIESMYSTSLWYYLNKGIEYLKTIRNAGLMLILADMYYSRNNDGGYDFSEPAFRTISCTDSDEDSSDRELNALITKLQHQAAPFTDPGKNADGTQRGEEAQYGWCHYYKVRAQRTKGVEIDNASNILVISSSYDPATPFENGVIAAKLVKGTLLSVANNSHCAYGKIDCATAITDEYVADPVAFTERVDARFYDTSTDEKYTGATNVSTKDLFSKVVKANTCQITSFRDRSAKEEEEEAETKDEETQPDDEGTQTGDTEDAAADDAAADVKDDAKADETKTEADATVVKVAKNLSKTGSAVSIVFATVLVFLVIAGAVLAFRRSRRW